MALFANATDLKFRTNKRSTPKLASCNFLASARCSEELAQSGHLAISGPSQIIGRFQFLKTLSHPNLCEYVEIHRGKHDRLFVVSEYYDNSLQKARSVKAADSLSVSLDLLRRWAREIVLALSYLRQNNIVHGALAPHNVLLDEEGHVKLSGYGLYYMTGQGADVDFPIGYPPYLSPEHVLGAYEASDGYYDKRDIWAVGVILAEQYTRSSFWTTSDVGLIFDSLTTLADWATEESDGGGLWHHKDIESLDINKDVLSFLQGKNVQEDQKNSEAQIDAFRQFIMDCLQVSPDSRPDVHALLSSPFLRENSHDAQQQQDSKWVTNPILASEGVDPDKVDLDHAETKQPNNNMLNELPISHIYHLWRLAGGDVELALIKRGVFLSLPVIERLPRTCFVNDGAEVGSDTTDTTQLYSDTMHILGFKELYQRLEDGRQGKNQERFEWDTDYFMVVDENDVNFLVTNNNGSDEYDENSNHCNKYYDELDSDFIFPPDPPQQQQQQQQLLPPLSGGVVPSSHHSTTPTPTTPSTSRSLHRGSFSLTTSISRSRSSSSLSIGSPTTPLTPTPPASSNPKLPLFLREQDVNYQYHRQILFTELLRQYPASRKEIIHHAKVDIPPLLRGKIWAAILDVRGDIYEQYQRIDKYNDTTSHRQIDVDVPRCHQYNQLLASSTGHDKLKRLLKSWVAVNKKLVYWQGLDSLCAPFLTLNFNDEAIAFACLQKFVLRFLNNLYLQDNAPVLQEYLALFRHLISFHDPELSSHLDGIGFQPELYAIPWFLTLFTHIFPLDKIYHLWDKFLVGPSSLPLFAGVAILRQIRDRIMACEFNDCIVLFSDSSPTVDIEKCIQTAMGMCKVTPPSLVARRHVGSSPGTSPVPSSEPMPWWEKPLPLETKKQELAPRVAVRDLTKIAPYALLLDIRPHEEFTKGHVASSMNVQVGQIDSYATILRKLNRKYHVVIANNDAQGPEFASELVRRHFPRTALLQGGVEAVNALYNQSSMQQQQQQRLCTCRPQKQTTASYKGKGSEPPFVIWRCKVPPPLSKK